MAYENDHLNLKATELRLGLPGRDSEPDRQTILVKSNKRASPVICESSRTKSNSSASNITAHENCEDQDSVPPLAKAQIVGWPPVRSYRKNCFLPKKTEADSAGMYVKVSVDGAPYLRKIDLKVYKSYPELLNALGNMFNLTIGEYSEREGYNGSGYAPTYEDKDRDWMLVGDVPWDMFISSCKRLRIIKGSEARGLGYL